MTGKVCTLKGKSTRLGLVIVSKAVRLFDDVSSSGKAV